MMEHKISFFGADNHAGIDWDNDSTHDDYKASPNGNVFIMWGMSDKNNEKYYLIVFDKDNVFYKKSFSSDLCVDLNNIYVFDDKTSILVADEYVLYLDENGENISKKSIAHNNEYGISGVYFWCLGEKENGDNCILVINLRDKTSTIKKTPSQDIQGFTNNIFWCFGSNEEDESELFIFNVASNKVIKRIIKDLDDDTLAYNGYVYFDGSSFVFLYGNQQNSIGYDTAGKIIEPSEKCLALAKVKQSELFSQRRKNDIERAKSQYQYWKSNMHKPQAAEQIAYYRNKLISLGIDIIAFENEYKAKIQPTKNTFTQDCNTTSNKSGCYIATCVYGSYDCPEVWTLRRYRDNTLGKTWYGRLFIRTYYAISPTLVKWFGKTKWFKKLWRGKIDKMVKKLLERGVENTPYSDKEW